ncbi:MAG: hypothetical protein ABEH81_01220 [Halopenitus sp.]
MYATLYNGDNVIDKVCWDFDVEPDDKDKYDTWEGMIQDFRKLTERLDEEGYSQMSVLSGGGMHKYLKSTEHRLEHPRDALREVQQKYQEELDLKTDDAIFGDIERIFRVPNTYHPGAERFCIPLKPDEVYLPKEEMVELAHDQRFGVDAITDGAPYPIHKHDSAGNSFARFETGDRIDGNFNPAEVEPEGTIFEIYPCIANLLQNWDEMEQKGHGLGFRRRFLIILHLKETGHTYDETVAILKKYMSSEEFYHCVQDEKQVRQIYRREDLLFPECDRLMTEIPCIHEKEDPCEKKDSLYV